MANDNKSLAHTKWNCKYHIVFAPKYRRKVFFGEKREAIGKIQFLFWRLYKFDASSSGAQFSIISSRHHLEIGPEN